MPANKVGSAFGSRTFHSTATGRARLTCAIARMSGSIERSPSTMSTTMEKIASITAMAIFGSTPVPIQMTNSGASATFGKLFSETSKV